MRVGVRRPLRRTSLGALTVAAAAALSVPLTGTTASATAVEGVSRHVLTASRTVSPATVSLPPGSFTWINVGTRAGRPNPGVMCLAFPVGPLNLAVEHPCAGGASAEGGIDAWHVQNVVGDNYKIVRNVTNVCLTASSGGNVTEETCRGDSSQVFTLVHQRRAQEFIFNLVNSGNGQCVEADPTGPVLIPNIGVVWKVVQATCSPLAPAFLWQAS